MKPRKAKLVKASIAKLAELAQTPVFKIVLHKPGAKPKAVIPGSKPQKAGMFPKSRDPRKVRGKRKLKAKHNSKLLFHLCALL